MFNFLYVAFGAVLRFCCSISGGYYILGLLFFTLIMEAVLFPLGIKQQKSSVKQAKLRPKEMVIREKYKGRNDRATQQKMQMEVQELYQKEGYNAFAGCLPLLIQLPIIFILYAVVRMPVTYSTKTDIALETQYEVAVEIIDGAIGAIDESGIIGKNGSQTAITEPTSTDSSSEAVSDVQSAEVSQESSSAPISEKQKELQTLRSNYLKTLKTFAGESNITNDRWNGGEISNNTNLEFTLVDLIINDRKTEIKNYLVEKFTENGIDKEKAVELVNKNIKDEFEFNAELKNQLPKFNYLGGKETLLDTPNQKGFSVLLLIPLLVFITSVLSFTVTRKLMPQPLGAENGPGSGKFMKWGMPALSTWFAYASFPAAVGVYWIYKTVVGMLKQYILSKMYPIPTITEDELAEYRKQMKQKKKKTITIEVDEDDDSYDHLAVKKSKTQSDSSNESDSDSDDYEMLNGDSSDLPENKVDWAPLKEDKPNNKKDNGDGKEDK